MANSKRISNPGCYPTGMIALVRPLVDAGLLKPGAGLVVHAISGRDYARASLSTLHTEMFRQGGLVTLRVAHRHVWMPIQG